MSLYTAKGKPGENDNVWSCRISALAAAGTSTVTFPLQVNVVEIASDTDCFIMLAWGGAAPAASGTNSAPVNGKEIPVGPSHGPAIVHAFGSYTTLGIKNVDTPTIAKLVVNGWQTAGGFGG